MKVLKRLIFFALCLAVLQTPALARVTGNASVSAQAASKKGLVKEKGKYYYYKSGKKVKNQLVTVKKQKNGQTVKYKYYFGKNGAAYTNRWLKVRETVKVNGKKKKTDVRYYFGKNGACYLATSDYGSKYNIKIRTIKDKRYGFETSGHQASGIYFCEKNERFYYFSARGVYKTEKTRKYRQAAREAEHDITALLKLLGDPLKKEVSKSCMFFDEEGVAYTETLYTYEHFTITSEIKPGSSVEFMYSVDCE